MSQSLFLALTEFDCLSLSATCRSHVYKLVQASASSNFSSDHAGRRAVVASIFCVFRLDMAADELNQAASSLAELHSPRSRLDVGNGSGDLLAVLADQSELFGRGEYLPRQQATAEEPTGREHRAARRAAAHAAETPVGRRGLVEDGLKPGSASHHPDARGGSVLPQAKRKDRSDQRHERQAIVNSMHGRHKRLKKSDGVDGNEKIQTGSPAVEEHTFLSDDIGRWKGVTGSKQSGWAVQIYIKPISV